MSILQSTIQIFFEEMGLLSDSLLERERAAKKYLDVKRNKKQEKNL